MTHLSTLKVSFAKNLLTSSAILICAIGLASCGGNSLPGAPPPSAKTLKSLSISPADPVLPLGGRAQFFVTGSFSDGSKQDMTHSVTWNSTQPAVAVVDSAGMAVSKQSGATMVTAASGAVSSATKLTVSPANLVSIAVSPLNSVVPKGNSVQFSATGRYSDGSLQDLTRAVYWTVSPSGFAAVDGAGVATAQAVGTATVTATSGSMSGAGVLVVSAASVVSMAVAPAKSSIELGSRQQLSATGTFSDGTTQDLTSSATWSSDTPSVAAITSPGLAVAQNVGTAMISATFGSLIASGALAVEPAAAGVNYFSHANTSGAPDGTLTIANPGLTGTTLCAMIYVFDTKQEMNECCGCPISPDGERVFSVNTDLTANTLTHATLNVGTVTIVPADQSSNPTCNAGSIMPAGTMASWLTHIQTDLPGAFATTEGESQDFPLTSSELAVLQDDCSFIQKLGSGRGVCTCGTGDGTPLQ